MVNKEENIITTKKTAEGWIIKIIIEIEIKKNKTILKILNQLTQILNLLIMKKQIII